MLHITHTHTHIHTHTLTHVLWAVCVFVCVCVCTSYLHINHRVGNCDDFFYGVYTAKAGVGLSALLTVSNDAREEPATLESEREDNTTAEMLLIPLGLTRRTSLSLYNIIFV